MCLIYIIQPINTKIQADLYSHTVISTHLKILLFNYQVFLLTYEEVELYSSISVDRQPLKQSINHLQQHATLITLRQDSHHLHWDV